MDRYTVDESEEFFEDELPAWLLKQQGDALSAEALANVHEKIRYKEGDQVGNFLFVSYMKYKNRAVFRCQECRKKFQYNIYGIKNKKRCKWCKTHRKT